MKTADGVVGRKEVGSRICHFIGHPIRRACSIDTCWYISAIVADILVVCSPRVCFYFCIGEIIFCLTLGKQFFFHIVRMFLLTTSVLNYEWAQDYRARNQNVSLAFTKEHPSSRISPSKQRPPAFNNIAIRIRGLSKMTVLMIPPPRKIEMFPIVIQ